MNIIPTTAGAKPGIQRDGTDYNTDRYIDGQNVRFYHEWATKMLGSEGKLPGNDEIVHSVYAVPKSQSHDIYLGRSSSLRFYNITNKGVVSPEISRTPQTLFSSNPQNLWSFTSYTQLDKEGVNPDTFIVAQVSPSFFDITSEEQGYVFVGHKNSINALVPLTDSAGVHMKCSGPVVVFGDYLCALDNNGLMHILDVSTPGGTIVYQLIASTKLVAAIPYQGSLLVWSLDSLYRLTLNPQRTMTDQPIFVNQQLAPNISIWSANSIVVYQNTVYWIGNGQFFQFSGAVGNLKNKMSNTWFFGKDGINRDYTGKIYSFVDYQNDEWWILYPRGTSIDNNFAEIYSPSIQAWNDTPIDRGTGLTLSTYPYRLMTSTKLYNNLQKNGQITRTYPIFEHEKGIDEVYDGRKNPVVAFLQWPITDFYTAGTSADNNVCIRSVRFEPDFILEGQLDLNIIDQFYAQDTPNISQTYTIKPDTKKIDISPTQGRQVSLRITASTLGTYFEIGRCLHGITKGSGAA